MVRGSIWRTSSSTEGHGWREAFFCCLLFCFRQIMSSSVCAQPDCWCSLKTSAPSVLAFHNFHGPQWFMGRVGQKPILQSFLGLPLLHLLHVDTRRRRKCVANKLTNHTCCDTCQIVTFEGSFASGKDVGLQGRVQILQQISYRN